MVALEPYYFEPNSEMIALKIVKWKIAWKNMDFADLVKDAKSVAGFSPYRQFRVGPNDVTNTAWLPRQFQNDGLRSRSFLSSG